MNSSKNRAGLIALLWLAALALGGVSWVLATRPAFGAIENSWICVNCGLQRAERVRKILELRGSPTTNTYAWPFAEILTNGLKTPCAHEWVLLHDVANETFFRPLPMGRGTMHILVDLRGITDAPEFAPALAEVAKADPRQARHSFKAIVTGFSGPIGPDVARLKQLLGAKAPQSEIVDQLKLLARNFTADRSSP